MADGDRTAQTGADPGKAQRTPASRLRPSTPIRLMAVVALVGGALALLLPGVAFAQTYSNPTPIVIPGPPPPDGCPTGPAPDNSCPSTPAVPYPSPIRVEGLTGGFFSYHIKVTLRGLTHNSPADLDVMLQLPEGIYRTMLMSDACAADTGQNPITQPIDLTFELSTTTAPFIPADTPCTTGTYRPFDDDDDPEFPFTGPDNFPAPSPPSPEPCSPQNCPPQSSPSRADGTWNLWVVDDTPGAQGVNSGQFAGGWSLEFTPRPPDPTLRISDATVTEGDSATTPAVFTVTLENPPASAVTVDYATSSSSALAGEDFLPVAGTLTFAPGEQSKTIALEVVGDRAVEENEFFVVDLTNAQGASIVENEGLGTILDDDGGAVTTTTTTIAPVTTTTTIAPVTTTTTIAPVTTTTTIAAVRPQAVASPQAAIAACDPNYPGVCIPPFPPDLNCGDIALRDFSVPGSDPHRFDGDNDSIGCESTDFPSGGGSTGPSGGGFAGPSSGGLGARNAAALARTGGSISDIAMAGLITFGIGLALRLSARKTKSRHLSR